MVWVVFLKTFENHLRGDKWPSFLSSCFLVTGSDGSNVMHVHRPSPNTQTLQRHHPQGRAAPSLKVERPIPLGRVAPSLLVEGVVPLLAAAAAGRGTTPLGRLIIQKLTITSLHVHYHPLSAQVGHHLQITMHVHPPSLNKHTLCNPSQNKQTAASITSCYITMHVHHRH